MPRRTTLAIWSRFCLFACGACAGTCACGETKIQLGSNEQSATSLAVDSILLRQAKTAELISTLSSGAGPSISLATLPSDDVSLEATVSGAVSSVQFVVDGELNIQEVPPFTYPGDTNGQLEAFVAVVGVHSVTATPYSQTGAEGQRGTSLSRAFTFVE
jgi:hypothetical protein